MASPGVEASMIPWSIGTYGLYDERRGMFDLTDVVDVGVLK